MPNASPLPAVLFFPFELLSHYLRCLHLAAAIRTRCAVYFLHSDRYTDLVSQAGFETFPGETINADEVMAAARRFNFSWLELHTLERVFHSQVDWIQRLEPVAALGDTAPTLSMAAEATRVPHVSLMNAYMTKYYQCGRRIPSVHPAARFQDRLPARVFEFMVRVGEGLAFRQVHRPFKELRRRNGLSSRRMYLDELEGEYNLICDVPWLFPQASLPANYRYIGPLYYQGEEPEEEIRDFLDNGRPSLLVSMGSSGDFSRVAFLNHVAFGDFNVVVAGNSRGVLQGGHMVEKPFLNSCAIMDRIDLVLCHGGNGTIYQALASGVPVLCVPTLFEQEWNVQGLVRSELGDYLDTTLKIDQLKTLIQSWMARKNNANFKQTRTQIQRTDSRGDFREFWDQTILARGATRGREAGDG